MKMDDTKKNPEAEKRIQGFILQQHLNKISVSKLNLKEDANIIQQKGRPIPTHLQDQVVEEIERLTKIGYLKKQQKYTKIALWAQ